MATYYLIDFENVGDDGLKGCEGLEPTDHLHLFYTDNANRISLDILNSHGASDFKLHKVPTRKQSLDMHLVSYLGYLIGTNVGEECGYIIISKDTDYDNIIEFWKDRHKIKISRRDKITSMEISNSVPKVSSDSTEINSARKPERVQSDIKVRLNSEVQQQLSQAHYDSVTINNVASLVTRHYGEDKMLCNVHNDLRKMCTEENYVELYARIKPILCRYASIESPDDLCD